jgi:hypothetical protein
MDMTAIVSPVFIPFSNAQSFAGAERSEFSGDVTHSGTLYARPGQDVALIRSGKIIP